MQRLTPHRSWFPLALTLMCTLAACGQPAATAPAVSDSLTTGRPPGTPTTGIGALALTTGTVVAWGDEPISPNAQTRTPAGLSGVMALSGGNSHTLALKSDGTVVAWGSNRSGEATVPAGLGLVTAVAAGAFHSLALRTDGTVAAWGANATAQTTVPAGLSGVVALAAGANHSLALKSDGRVVGWGYDFFGQASVPGGLSGVTAVAAGGQHSLALRGDGTVVAWGSNSSGQTSVPAGLTGVTAIAAGSYYSLALKSDGTVVAWGENGSGQTSVPAGLTGVKAIAAGNYHSLALKMDGTVVGWGLGDYGQLKVPAGLSGVRAIAAGGYYSLAVVDAAITPRIDGQAGQNGWYTGPVSLNWQLNVSPVSSASGCDPLTLSADTAGQTFTCTVTSDGVESRRSVTLRIDQTAPSLSPVVTPRTVLLGGVATVAPNAQDTLSGLASAPCSPVITSNVGPQTVFCSATDHAGNTAYMGADYTVAYDFGGFLSPDAALPGVNTVRAGSSLSVSFSLHGNQGLAVLASGFPQVLRVACATGAPTGEPEPVTNGASALTYSAKSDSYTYLWKTSKAATGCARFILKLADSTEHVFAVQFR